MINLDSHSSLGRWKSQNGANRSAKDADTVPSYIRRCRYKRLILAEQKAIMAKLSEVFPEKYAQLNCEGFDTRVMLLSDDLFEWFDEKVQAVGVVDAYVQLSLSSRKVK